MEEFKNILDSYQNIDLKRALESKEEISEFSIKFYTDVAEIYDAVTRIRNIERNPTGFNFNDAAILGLLIRIGKLLKEAIYYYKIDNGQLISFLDRPILEAAVVSRYLLVKGDEVIEDYRKCSYKNRISMLNDPKGSEAFYNTPEGISLKNSILRKMEAENFTVKSFDLQKIDDGNLMEKLYVICSRNWS